MPSSRESKWSSIAPLLGLILSASALVPFLIRVYGRIIHPYASNYSEPVIAWASFHIREYPWIYKSFDAPPYTVFAYNPLYAYAQYLVSMLTGQNFIGGRLISFLAYIFTAYFAYKIVASGSGSKKTSLFLSFCIVSSPILQKYAAEARPDMLGLCLTAAGILFAVRWYEKAVDRTTKDTFLALLFFTLAFFARQSYIFAPAAFILLLFLKRLPRQAVFFACLQFILFVVPMLFLNAVTDGAYAKNVILFNLSEYSFPLARNSWFFLVPFLFPLIAAGFVFFLVRLARKQTDFFDLYFVFVILSGFMSGRIGSDSNYFIESCFGIGLYLSICIENNFLNHRRLLVRLAAWIFLAGFFLFFNAAKLRDWPLLLAGRASELTQNKVDEKLGEVTRVIRKMHGVVLSEDMGLLMQAGKPIMYEPFEFAQLSRNRLWDENQILEKIKRQEFAILIVTTNIYAFKETSRFTPRMILQIRESYKPYGVLHGFIFLVPK